MNLDQFQQCLQFYYGMVYQQALQTQQPAWNSLTTVQIPPTSMGSCKTETSFTSNFSIASLTNSTPNSSAINDSGISSPSQGNLSYGSVSQEVVPDSTPSRNSQTVQIKAEEYKRWPDGKYHCPICKKGFTRRFYLEKAHMNIHNNIAPYKCNKCNRCFKDASNRRTHERICQHTHQPY